MKRHPNEKILQDYFEDLLGSETSERVKGHLLKCDECSEVVATLAICDESFKKSVLPPISPSLNAKVMASAETLLAVRRERRRSAQEKVEMKQRRQERIKEWTSDMKDFLAHEAKFPAIQVAGLSVFVAMLVQIQRYEEKTIEFDLIDNTVQTYERID